MIAVQGQIPAKNDRTKLFISDRMYSSKASKQEKNYGMD